MLKVRRGYSSDGRAPALQAGGHEFESRYLHVGGARKDQRSLARMRSIRGRVRKADQACLKSDLTDEAKETKSPGKTEGSCEPHVTEQAKLAKSS